MTINFLEKNKWFSWTITILIFILIFYMSNIRLPPPEIGPITITAMLYHISIFFLLTFFFFVSALDRKFEWKKIILALFIVVIYAVLDELHQYFVPGRYASINDFLFDFTGIIFASLIYFILILKKKIKS